MTKQLVTIEFRYKCVPNSDLCSCHRQKTITVGIYDTIEEAVAEGNKAVNKLLKNYKINGEFNVKDSLGVSNRIVTDYTNVFAKITELKFDDVEATMNEVAESNAKFIEYKKTLRES